MKKLLSLFLIMFLALFVGCNKDKSKEEAMRNIDLAITEVNIASTVTTSLTLPLKANNELVTISWLSDKPDYISNEGVVNRPSYDVGNIEVTLTATFAVGEHQKIKQYKVVVTCLEEEPIHYDYESYYKYTYDGDPIEYMKDWKIAGFYNKDDTLHILPEENITTGKSLNVTYYGAVANDSNFDNTISFKTAMAAANAGDEIYIPNGTYYFKTTATANPYYAHILAKTGVNITGESQDGVKLICSFSEKECLEQANTTVLAASNCHNVVIKNLTISAIVADSDMPDPNESVANNPAGNKSAPQFGIVVYGNTEKTYNVVIRNVTVEYFQYSGIRLHDVSDCAIYDSKIQKATDLGGGGAGYAIEIRGYGHEQYQYIDTDYDCYFNRVSGVEIIGPYIRHGIILSYMTHNNLIDKNILSGSLDDAIDVHGQDEFLNVFAYNVASTSRVGAGLGLGNTGSTHDASGVGNVIYKNSFISNNRGITIIRGTNYTVCVENTITSCNTAFNRDGTDKNTVLENNIIN